MSPEPTLPATWQGLPAEFRRCFSSSTFPVFCALTTGLVACTQLRHDRGRTDEIERLRRYWIINDGL